MYQNEKRRRDSKSVLLGGGGAHDPHFTLLITIVPERFRNKLNHFSFCLIFETLFVTCAEFLTIKKSAKLPLSGLNPRPLKSSKTEDSGTLETR